VAQIWAYETPFGFTATNHFDGDGVTVELVYNVGLPQVETATLRGRMA
jgi:hypothetical protein